MIGEAEATIKRDVGFGLVETLQEPSTVVLPCQAGR